MPPSWIHCLSVVGERFFFPNPLFGNEYPRLRRLKLYSCNIAWDSPIFSAQLNHLSIRFQSSITRPSSAQLLSVLENLPYLEELSLEGAICNPDPDHLIEIPRLTRIAISGIFQDCGYLHHIAYPDSTIVLIDCEAGEKVEGLSFAIGVLKKNLNKTLEDQMVIP